MIRVHRYQTNNLVAPTDQVLLNNFKWPIEYIMFGIRPTVNVSSSNLNQYRDWHKMTLATDNRADLIAQSHTKLVIDSATAFNAVTANNVTLSSQESAGSVVFPSYTETINTLAVVAHGINIFNNYGAHFYRDYLAYTFGDANINTSEDLGLLLINFCLYPGTYQPSGHVNTSRTREFYVQYSSSYVSSATPGEMISIAMAINFLLISDGSAVLRYST